VLPLIQIFKDVNKEQKFGDGLAPDSDAYTNGKLSFISTDLFIKGSTEHFLKHIASGNIILPVDGHRAHFSFALLIQCAVENGVTIILLQNRCTHVIQPLDEGFLAL
jgi:hypothetical protein